MSTTKTCVTPTFESIYNEIALRASKAKFTSDFFATQITLTGKLEFRPLYVKVEDRKAEVAPYEYNNASFYIDADTDVFAAILNGKRCICDAISEHAVVITGDPNMVVLFIKAMQL